MEPVRNSRNQMVVEAARLHRVRDRTTTGTTLLEGPHLLQEAVGAGADVRQVFVRDTDDSGRALAEGLGVVPVLVDQSALKRLAGTETPRGPIAVVTIPPSLDLGDRNMLVSWGVSDPGNVGTMIRIARAFDWGFGFTSGTADPWSPKVLRSGAGNQFATPMLRFADLEDLRSIGLVPVATEATGGGDPADLESGRWAILIGEEASGLPNAVVEACDRCVTIPMPGGAESLNAAVAAAIIVYEISRTTVL